MAFVNISERSSSPKATGGGGFDFEHKVGAYFLSCLLKGASFDSQMREPTRIDFQTIGKGWLLDDLLVTGNLGRLALSIRSSKQIAANKFPDDFVGACWRLTIKGDPFNIDVDHIGLIDPGMVVAARTAWQELSNWAQTKPANELKEALERENEANEAMRSLYNSFGCPTSLSSGLSDVETLQAKLISRVIVFNWDFENSSDEKILHGLRNCSESLKDPGEAGKLWDRLVRLAAEYDNSAGTFTQSSLYDKLQRDFNLKSPESLFAGKQSDLIYSLRRSESECIEAWKLLGLSVQEAKDLLQDDNVGEGNASYIPTQDQPIKLVVAPLGYGKTLLAERILQNAIRAKLQNPDAPFPQIWSAEDVSGMILENTRSFVTSYSNSEKSFLIIIDKLDEIDSGLAQKILLDCRKTQTIHDQYELHFLLLSRPLAWQEDKSERIDLLPASSDQLDQLYAKIAGRSRSWRAEDETKAVHEALKSPLFVILAALFVKENNIYQRPSPSELIQYWVDKRLSSDSRFNTARAELTKLARYVLDSPTGQVERAQIQDKIDVELILKSGLARTSGSKISFSLRILAEWFGSEYLRSRTLNAEALELKLESLDRWLPSFRIFIANAGFEEIEALASELQGLSPAFSFLTFEDIDKNWRWFRDTSNPLITPVEMGRQMRIAMAAWVLAFGDKTSKIIAPIRSDGSLRSLGIASTPMSYRLNEDIREKGTYAWSFSDSAPTEEIFDLEEFLKGKSDNEMRQYFRTLYGVSFRTTSAQLWLNVRNELSKQLQKVLQNMQLSLISQAARNELVWGSALLACGLSGSDIRSIPISQVLGTVSSFLSGSEISRRNGLPIYSKLLIDTCINIATRGESVLIAPYSPIDPKQLTGTISTEVQNSFLNRSAEVLTAALNIYKEMVESYFPTLRDRMNSYQLLPAKLFGKVSVHGHIRGFNSYINYAIVPLPFDQQNKIELKLSTDDSRWYDEEVYSEVRKSFSQIELLRPTSYQWLHINIRGGPLEVLGHYPALDWAYKLLCWDLKELGVIKDDFKTEAEVAHSHW